MYSANNILLKIPESLVSKPWVVRNFLIFFQQAYIQDRLVFKTGLCAVLHPTITVLTITRSHTAHKFVHNALHTVHIFCAGCTAAAYIYRVFTLWPWPRLTVSFHGFLVVAGNFGRDREKRGRDQKLAFLVSCQPNVDLDLAVRTCNFLMLEESSFLKVLLLADGFASPSSLVFFPLHLQDGQDCFLARSGENIYRTVGWASCSADRKMLSRAAKVAKQEIFVSFTVLLSLLADVALGEKLCKCSVNLVGMVHCVQSVSFSDFIAFSASMTISRQYNHYSPVLQLASCSHFTFFLFFQRPARARVSLPQRQGDELCFLDDVKSCQSMRIV